MGAINSPFPSLSYLKMSKGKMETTCSPQIRHGVYCFLHKAPLSRSGDGGKGFCAESGDKVHVCRHQRKVLAPPLETRGRNGERTQPGDRPEWPHKMSSAIDVYTAGYVFSISPCHFKQGPFKVLQHQASFPRNANRKAFSTSFRRKCLSIQGFKAGFKASQQLRKRQIMHNFAQLLQTWGSDGNAPERNHWIGQLLYMNSHRCLL